MKIAATDKDHFRDSLSTVDSAGKRVWLYPKKPSGKLYNARNFVAYGLLALLFAGPFLRINGLPVLMLNVVERKFIIFGGIFWPQDFFILLLAFLTLVVFIILFTVIYGRIFCGWVCPQTIFMESVFRRIEYLFEGDFMKQKALDKAPWDFEKIWRKGGKHLVFVLISFIIANTFLAYIIGSDELIRIMTDNPLNHLAGLGTLVVFTGIFYAVFAKFREQVCHIACPYGRLQGVMTDKNTITIIYDYLRGEPRGKMRKNTERTEGDCIDCNQCVQVCPMGIDIRNGTQLECTNCTACIDACDSIMDLIEKPRGLIRYDSEENVATGSKFRIGGRIISYSIVLLILASALVTMLVIRDNIDATILRTPGQMYQKTDHGTVTNLYNISLINKTQHEMPLTLKVISPEGGKIKMVGSELVLPGQGKTEGVFFIEIPQSVLKSINSKIKIGVYSGDELLIEEKTKFLAPSGGATAKTITLTEDEAKEAI